MEFRRFIAARFGRRSAAWRRHSFAAACVRALLAVTPAAFAESAELVSTRDALTQYKIDAWQTDQGLPLNTVQCLLQTRDGYLWIGTGGGLARFDGVRFATFENSSNPELASRSIFGLMEDSAGNLWIGHGHGAVIYRDGRFRTMFGREVTNGRRVWSFAQARDGAIWAATENGLVHWNHGVKRVYKRDDGLPTDRLRAITIATDGTVWIATTGGGLVAFDGKQFKTLTTGDGLPHLAVRSVLHDATGGVWASTAGGGLAHIDAARRVTRYGIAEGLPTDQLTALAYDRDGSLWIGTWGAGVVRLKNGKFTSISTEGGLAGEQIWSVHADRDGSIWVGTWVGGLNRLRRRDFVVLGAPEGLSHDNVRSVLHARDGVTWTTTAGGGVNRIANGEITRIGKSEGLPTDETSSILEDRDGSLWIGTYTSGVVRLRDGTTESYGATAGFTNLDVRSLLQDRHGTVWVGTTGGLARFNGNGFTHVTEEGAPREVVSTMLEDRAGTLWFGTPDGLFRYSSGRFSRLSREDGLVSNWIMDLYEDSSGSIWIGTNGEGMNRFRDGRIAAYRTSDGLWDGMAQVILEDRLGNLWITCNRGFFRVSRAEMDEFAEGRRSRVSSIAYGPGDALRSTSFAGGHQPAGAIDSAGKVWLPSFSGIVIVDPAHLPRSGEAPRAQIEEVTLNGETVPLGAVITLPPGSVPLSIRYTSTTSLRTADRVRFRYRMEGANGGWVDAARSREAFFPTLPHGTYRFQVASSYDGVSWGSATAPLSIVVRPYFFQTRWFYTVAVLGLLLAAASVLSLRTRHLRRQKAEMERLVREKTEELRLANEHLARLSFVDSLTGVANRRRFDEALDQEWQRAKRFQTSLALLLIDVDLFKPYNDTFGHPEGDKCLATVAEVLQSSVRRAGDLVARYGGEEFVVLIPGADYVSALEFAEGLRAACEERAIPHPASDVAPVVTITIGVAACIPSGDESSQSLVHEADAALYQAKRQGRNRVRHLSSVPAIAAHGA